MDEKNVLDLNSITVECKLLEDIGAEVIITNINDLDSIYRKDRLIAIYNHFLSLSQNPS